MVSVLARPEEVRRLRRAVRGHLLHWGLEELTETAQLCVSELAANVITHVGVGTPMTLTVAVRGANLCIEVHDPDGTALPTLLSAGPDAESGRGMHLLDSLTDRWGVTPGDGGKTTWCELSTDMDCADELGDDAEASPSPAAGSGEEAAIRLIADLLHWLRAHGRETDEVMKSVRESVDAQQALRS